MERSSSSYTSKARSRVLCLCNIEAPLVTSWTEDNPGGVSMDVVYTRKGCNYFEWHDPIANIRQKKIIVALMKKVDELKLREKDLQSRISDMKMKENFLGIVLVVSWIVIEELLNWLDLMVDSSFFLFLAFFGLPGALLMTGGSIAGVCRGGHKLGPLHG
ncbi:hypothetical protein HKD37_04G010850 [Glycine soja]